MTPHPLDPLSPVEIERAAAIVRGHGGLSEAAWFETIALAEPDRNAPANPRRRAFVCCYDPAAGETWDGIADLAAGELLSWQHVEGAQARIVADEFAMGGEIAKADPRFREACARRGITDLAEVLVEPWAAGHFAIAEEEGERIAYGHCWLRNQAGDNPYARPIANLHPVIDLRRRRLLRIDDGDLVPLPPESTAIMHPEPRQDLKPLAITQPEGASFTVEGNCVRWQKWQFRLGFNVREGMTLHAIGYEDGGRLRPIMHRASLAEMVVPYGDPTGGNYRRNAFDTGEYGVGQFLDPLTLGCDCLGHIHYFDVWSHDWYGRPRRIANAICIHEEDFGILWKFSDLARRPDDGASVRAGWWCRHRDHRQLRLRLLLVLLPGRHDRHRGEGDRRPAGRGPRRSASRRAMAPWWRRGSMPISISTCFRSASRWPSTASAIRCPRSILPALRWATAIPMAMPCGSPRRR